MHLRSTKVWWLLLLLVGVQVCHLCAQSHRDVRAAPTLREFFRELVENYRPSLLPNHEDLLKVTDQVAGARPEDISGALPAIFTALAHQDDDVKIYAASALFAISRRFDSADLLRGHINAIGRLLDVSDPRLQATPPLIFASLKPTPPPEVLPLLVAFLRRTDRDPQAQGGAVFTLVRLAPEKQEVVTAIQKFLSRPLDTGTRIGTLNALGTPRVKDARLINSVIASLDDSDQGVRVTAIRVLARIGHQALLSARPALQRLADDARQPAEVRREAAEALQQLRRGGA